MGREIIGRLRITAAMRSLGLPSDEAPLPPQFSWIREGVPVRSQYVEIENQPSPGSFYVGVISGAPRLVDGRWVVRVAGKGGWFSCPDLLPADEAELADG